MCQTIQSLLITSKEWSLFELCRLLVIFPERPLSLFGFFWYAFSYVVVVSTITTDTSFGTMLHVVVESSVHFVSANVSFLWHHWRIDILIRSGLACSVWRSRLSVCGLRNFANHHSHMSNHVSLRLLGRYLEGLHHRILPFMFFNLSFHLVPPWRQFNDCYCVTTVSYWVESNVVL